MLGFAACTSSLTAACASSRATCGSGSSTSTLPSARSRRTPSGASLPSTSSWLSLALLERIASGTCLLGRARALGARFLGPPFSKDLRRVLTSCPLLSLSLSLTSALQFHPLDARLWILAASFEYEHNNNMVAARGMRLFKQSPQRQHALTDPPPSPSSFLQR